MLFRIQARTVDERLWHLDDETGFGRIQLLVLEVIIKLLINFNIYEQNKYYLKERILKRCSFRLNASASSSKLMSPD